MKTLIRQFIRESFLQSKNKSLILEISISDYEEAEDTGDPEFESPTYDGGIDRGRFETLLGKRFAFEDGGEPEFQVAAENIGTNAVIIMPYPVDNVDFEDVEEEILLNPTQPDPSGGMTDYIEGEGAAAMMTYVYEGEAVNRTAEKFKNKLGAEPLSADSPVIVSALSRKDGWETDNILHSLLQRSVETTKWFGYPNAILGNAFLMKRDMSKLRPPIRISTETGIKKVAEFKCAKEPPAVIASLMDVLTWNLEAMSDIEWAENAACFYEYSNDVNKAMFAGVIAISLSLLLAPETLGASLLAPLAVAGTGMTIQDALCRVPVIIWAGVTNRWKFAAANLAYLVVIIAFESAAKFKSARSGLKTATITGADAVKQSGKLELGAATLMSRNLKNVNVPSMTAEKFSEVVSRASKNDLEGWFVSDEKLAGELYEAIDKMDFWTVTKITITGIVLQIATGMFGESAAEKLGVEIDSLLEGDLDFQKLLEADTELLAHAASIREKYPIR